MQIRHFASLLALVLAAGGTALKGWTTTTAAQTTEVSILASVIDAKGEPIDGLSTTDFAIREGGVEREVISAKRSTEPIRVALLMDTTPAAERDIVAIRKGFQGFVRTLLAKSPEAQISLWEFGQAAVRTKDFTSDGQALESAIGRTFPKMRAASVLLEGLVETSQALSSRGTPRRAIVLLNMEPSDEQSRQEPRRINESLRLSRAQIWAISLQNGQLKNAQRDVVLNTLVRNAGGRREFIFTASAIDGYLQQYAAALATQYEITYRRPVGRHTIVETGVRREGARAIAGIFAPQ